MYQEIPEHPASYMADVAVIAAIILSVIFMIMVW